MKTLLLSSVLLLVGGSIQTASASGVLVPRDGSPPIHVRSHRVSALVEDGLARTTLRQTFVNPYNRMLEAIYLFPLPEGASLTGLAMEVGGQRLEGFLAERRTARRTYDNLVRRRKDPALVEQIGHNTFRLSVFPVLPNEPTIIEISWIESVPLVQGEYRYIYPLALGSDATQTEQDLTVSVTMRSSAPITQVSSPLDDMAITKVSAHEACASLERSGAKLAEDIVVTARVKTPDPSIDIHIYRPAHGEAFFAAVVTPPMLTEEEVIPRDVTLALDISGSMKGVKFQQARKAGLWLIDHLRARDRVNIIVFNATVRSFDEEPVPATTKNRRRLRRFLEEIEPGGGTALGDALRRACEAPKEPGRAAMTVFLTDGLPTVGETRPEKIITFAREGTERGLKTFTFGVGKDVGSTLLQGIAAAGGGTTELFRPEGEVESRLVRFLNRTSSPAIVDLQVKVDGRRVEDLLPRPLDDIYLGEQAVLTGRIGGTGKKTLVVRGVLKGEPLELRSTIDLSGDWEAAGSPDTIARDLYARAKLAFLEQAIRLRGGLSDQAYFAAVDQGRYSTQDELVSAMIDHSLETGVQCAYTAFIALLPEDRARLDPRNAQALEEAMERARKRRRKLAGVDEKPESTSDTRVAKNAQPRGSGHLYTGPGDIVPPNFGGGGDTTPPANPGGPGTPGPGAGRTSGLRLGSGGTAGPVVPDGGAARARGARTGGFTKRGSGAGFEQWEFWWEYNKEIYMNLRGQLSQRGYAPGSAGGLLGEQVRAGILSNRVSSEDVKTTILPALKEALGAGDADVVDSAVLAIARILPGRKRFGAFDNVLETLGHPRESAREAATLALGVLGDERARPTLLEIMRNTAKGRRRLASKRSVPDMIRGFAAISLGLIGNSADIQPLIDIVDQESDSLRNLKSCALLALGMFGDDQERIITYLLEVMDRSSMSRRLRSLAPIALAKLDQSKARAAGLGPLLDAAHSGETDNDMLRSVVIALGKLAEMSDTEVVDTLESIIEHHNDAQSRHFAYIALGEIAARDRQGFDGHAKAHEELLERLLTGLTHPRTRTHQPWAALALGLYARAYRDDPARAELVRTAIQHLTETFQGSANPSYRGAMAIALGLLHAEGSGPVLLDLFEQSHHDALRGYLAVALGLMGQVEAAGEMRAMIIRPGLDWRFRLNLARGLGLMGDVQSLGFLTGLLEQATTISETASLAQAIGLIGDRSAMAPLIKILQDKAKPGQLRGFCAVALGLLAEKTAFPWNARISVDLNYRSKTEAIAEILDIL